MIPTTFSKIPGSSIPEVMRHHIGWLAIELAPFLFDHEPGGKHEFNIVFEVDFAKAAESNKALMTGGLAVVSTRRLPEPDDEVEVKLTRRQVRMLHGIAAHKANISDYYRGRTAGAEQDRNQRQFVEMQDIAIRLDNAEAKLAEEKGE